MTASQALMMVYLIGVVVTTIDYAIALKSKEVIEAISHLGPNIAASILASILFAIMVFTWPVVMIVSRIRRLRGLVK